MCVAPPWQDDLKALDAAGKRDANAEALVREFRMLFLVGCESVNLSDDCDVPCVVSSPLLLLRSEIRLHASMRVTGLPEGFE